MGRIKQTYLKRVAEKLLTDYEGDFNIDFKNNKTKVSEFSTVESKTIRNKIAGYITRVKEHEKKEKERIKREEAQTEAALNTKPQGL